jgi:hypothetical protein
VNTAASSSTTTLRLLVSNPRFNKSAAAMVVLTLLGYSRDHQTDRRPTARYRRRGKSWMAWKKGRVYK